MLNGRYDDGTPESTSEPDLPYYARAEEALDLYRRHIPPPEIGVPLVNAVLDETLGPVSRSKDAGSEGAC